LRLTSRPSPANRRFHPQNVLTHSEIHCFMSQYVKSVTYTCRCRPQNMRFLWWEERKKDRTKDRKTEIERPTIKRKTEWANDRTTERLTDIRATVNTVKVVHICLHWHTFDSRAFGRSNDSMQVVRVRRHITLMLHTVKVGKLLSHTHNW